ncbi:MAG: hypothetical protein HY747_06165 [Elusimicrobia bacterium]|nr:hypothetical protein [Elusimicrobiota bacterium]
MLQIKAVEFMRDLRNDLEGRYAGLTLQERAERIKKEVEESPIWKDFLKQHRRTPVKQARA